MLGLLFAPAAGPAAGSEPRDSWTAIFENDEFHGDSDRHYTSGFRAAWASAPDALPDWLGGLARALPTWSEGGGNRAHVAFGQSIFAPEVLLRDPPDPDDRPYAGWLYGTIGFSADHDDTLETLGLTLGIVGPASGAAQAQKIAHALTGSTSPRGWEHQIDTEPGLILSYERKWRNLLPITPTLQFDLMPHVTAALGNVFTYAGAGAMIRFGQGLAADYGPPRIRPGMPGADFLNPVGDLAWYVFVGAEGRAVARNLFLDGSTFGGGPEVDRKTFVGDLQAGAALLFGRTRIAYTHVFRTKEFDGQQGPDWYGSVSVTWSF